MNFIARTITYASVFAIAFAGGCDATSKSKEGSTMKSEPTSAPTTGEACDVDGSCGTEHWKTKTDAEWRKLLTPEQYNVARQAGTERPYTGKYWNDHTPGVYLCAACGQELFNSEAKFESGTGWPSFWKPITPKAVETHSDTSFGAERTEVTCSRCGAHLGHVFEEGPKPTGLSYCMNSAVLNLKPKQP